jgi:putative ABC transport system permease protein
VLKIFRRVWYALRRRHFDRELRDELEFHLEMKRRELEADGRGADASLAAKREVGNLISAREQARDVWLPGWYQGLSLDCVLAIRMLRKYPGLTIVGGLAMAFGIAVGVGGFEILTQRTAPRIPLEDGDRIVGIRSHDVQTNVVQRRTAYDLARWRDTLSSIEQLGAFADDSRNLTVGGLTEPADVALMTASGFQVARVPPMLGRTLTDSDEAPAAPPVAVIGYDLWQRRFAGDPAVAGRAFDLGGEHTTIVGVMPEGFEFPVAHTLWVPLRLRAPDVFPGRPGEGPELFIFGRLAPGVTMATAQAELSAVGLRTAADARDTHAFVRPQVLPFARMVFGVDDARVLLFANVFLVMLLVLACSNVALLMFARSATRETEMALRSALGASRRRIVAQLFVEALVLSLVSVGVGLIGARLALRSYWAMNEADSGRRLPFWIGDQLSPATVVYGVMLTVLAAVIIGMLPALRVTGRGRLMQLRQAGAGGGGYRFGGAWTLVIVAQVAMTLTFPVVGFSFHRWVVLARSQDVGFPSGEFLSARLALDRNDAAAPPPSAYAELVRRLAAEPGVAGVTLADRLPGTRHQRTRLELDSTDGPEPVANAVNVAAVDENFFRTIGAPVRSGRGFTAADVASGLRLPLSPPRAESRGGFSRTITTSPPAIVNRSFVSDVLKGQHAIGRRIRRAGGDGRPPGPWREIVGVVDDLGMGSIDTDAAGIYSPLDPDAASAVRVAVHVHGAPASFAPRLRAVAAEVDPLLRVDEVVPLDDAAASEWLESQYVSRLLMAMSAIALLLSLTATYSVMAVTVTQRTREIGIRTALGAPRHRVVAAIFRRPLIQVGLGVLTGFCLAAATAYGMSVGLYDRPPQLDDMLMVVPYAVVMAMVCLLACVVPTRRALALQPADVLRAEG